MDTINNDYNTQRNHLIIREYGRHVQNLIAYARSIEDKNERQQVMETIITMMGHLNPHLKNVADFKHKLWDHLFMIGGFDLDVDSPYDRPDPEIAKPNPAQLEYPAERIRFRHYGKNVETMVEKARGFTDREQRQGLTEVIVNFMKMAYHNWSREEVSDELIRSDLDTLSKGTLVIDDEMNTEAFIKSPQVKAGKPKSSAQHGKGGKKYSGNHKRRQHSAPRRKR